MSEVITAAVEKLSQKVSSFAGVAKFVIPGEGAIMLDGAGVRAADDEADVTLSANRETFEGILNGEVNATMAFMTGKLKVDGSMGMAMKLGALLG